MTNEHVFYMHDKVQTKMWAYRSLPPVAMYGTAPTLDAARADIAVAILSAREPGEDKLTAVEHVEFIHPLGFVMRVKMSAGQDDYQERVRAANIVGTTIQYASEHSGTVDVEGWGMTGLGYPMIIVCLPSDTVDDVVEQLDVTEASAIALAFEDDGVGFQGCWVSGIMREHAEFPSGHRVESLAQAHIELDATIEEFMQASGVTREAILSGKAPPYVSRPMLLATAV